MSEQKAIRVGLIGAGGIVKQRHMPGLSAISGVEITTVSNSTVDSATAFCRTHAPEARVLARWEDVVKSDDVDVIWIGAPPYLHADATCLALDSGKHVFTQARMAADLPAAQRMWEAAIRHPELVTAICPAPHGMRGGELVKKLLAEGAIGTPHQMLLHSHSAAWLDARQPAHWRQRVEISGVQILTLGIYTEVVQRWLGDITEVCARGRVVLPDRVTIPAETPYTVETPDFTHVLCHFRSGVEGVMIFSGVAASAPGDRLHIHGSAGTLVYDFTSEEVLLGKPGESLQPVPVPDDLVREWTVEADFIRAVRDPAAPRPMPDFHEGLRYMRVVQGVWDSMPEGCPVQVV
jgi:predicted dehydrogenase